jgi:hypothetical protein
MLACSLLVSGLGGLAAACQRKAPGPEECHVFAKRVVARVSGQALEWANAKEAVDDLTVRCLTTPFSRSLLACVQAGGRVADCFAAHGVRLERSEPEFRSPFFEPEN